MLKCDNITVKSILDGIAFDACEKSFTAVIGKNGSGKTTLAKCIMSQIKFDGSATLCGKEISGMSPRERARKIAYLPQALPSPNITVRELVSMGRNPYTSLGKKLGTADTSAIENALSLTSMCKFADRLVTTLSGGEKQRAFLAMMLATDAEILLLDEPCAYMDMATEAEFMGLIASLDKTLIVITHNISLAVKHADNILVLDEGKQVFFGSKEECIEKSVIENVFNVERIQTDKGILFRV